MLGVVIGRRRQGKSTLALALALERRKTVLIFDPNDQYRNIDQITDLEGWLDGSTDRSIGRIVPAPPIDEHWQQIAATIDGGKWEWSDYVLILDEASMLMSPQSMDDMLERYVRTAPRDIDVIVTTHRPRDIHPLMRALATDWFVFQTQIALDVDVIRKNFGDDLAAVVQRLPEYHVAHHWLDRGGVPRTVVWDRPQDWYIDIGRST